MNLLNTILDFVFPKTKQQKKLEGITDKELQNLLKIKEHHTGNIKTVSLFEYKNDIVKSLIKEIKFNRNLAICNMMAKILHDEIVSKLSEDLIMFDGTLPIVIPIPISKQRRNQRGYNQCENLTKSLEKIDQNQNYLCKSDILYKTADTQSQVKTLSREERLNNLKNSFEAKLQPKYRDKNIFLVDDVLTTGATLTEASYTLRSAGYRKISAFVIAH